jgi:antitoxin component YwqK of YwqJK toxin-antitoxin module
VWTEWYESGQKKSEITYRNGIENGPVAAWHENGRKRAEGRFKNGRPEGLWMRWDESSEQQSDRSSSYPRQNRL